MTYVCFIGPCSGKPTGQYNCFLQATKIDCNKKIFDIGGESISSLYKVYLAIRSFFGFLLFNLMNINVNAKVYITPSRSLLGFIRELPFFILSFLFQRTVICHWHGADLKEFTSSQINVVRKFVLFVFSQCDVHVVLTEKMKEQLDGIDVKAIEVIPNFYDFELVDINCDCDCSDDVKILYLSNLIEEKGIKDAINAFRLAYKERKDIQLTIVGSFSSSSTQFNDELKTMLSSDGVVYRARA